MGSVLFLSLSLLANAPGGVTLRGSVVDASGDPISGALVDIATAAPHVGKGLFCPSCYPDCQKKTRTGANGEFVIEGLSPALKFRVLIGAPGKKPLLTEHIDPLNAPTTFSLADVPTDVPAERIVTGVIVDDMKRPVEGALVEVSGVKTADRRWFGANKAEPTVTDARGEFRLFLPDGYQAVDVEVFAEGFAGTKQSLLTPGEKSPQIVLPSGARVTGRLLADGKPANDVRIAVVQTNRSGDGFFIKAVAATSEGDGRFAFDYLPAAQEYVIFSVVGEDPQALVLTTKRFTVPNDRQERDLGDLTLVPAMQISGQLQLAAGQQAPAHARLTISRDPAWDLISVPIATDGRFQIRGLPSETYTLGLAADNLQIASERLKYQSLGNNQFGIRLKASLDSLVIPLQP